MCCHGRIPPKADHFFSAFLFFCFSSRPDPEISQAHLAVIHTDHTHTHHPFRDGIPCKLPRDDGMRPGDPGSSSEAVHDFPDLYKQARFFFSVSPSLSHPLAPKAACRSNGSVFSQAQEGSEDWGAEAAAGGLAAGGPWPG